MTENIKRGWIAKAGDYLSAIARNYNNTNPPAQPYNPAPIAGAGPDKPAPEGGVMIVPKPSGASSERHR